MIQAPLRVQSSPATATPGFLTLRLNNLCLLVVALCTPMLVQADTLKERVAQGRAATPEGPCPFFDAAVVKRIFPNSANEPIFKRREKPFPSCTYIWKASKMNTLKMAGQPVAVPSEGRLTLTEVATRSEAKDWERVLMGYKNQQLTPIPALGQYAVWSDKRRQLSFIAKGHIFHVAVEDIDQPEAQQKNALAVAAELVRTH